MLRHSSITFEAQPTVSLTPSSLFTMKVCVPVSADVTKPVHRALNWSMLLPWRPVENP